MPRDPGMKRPFFEIFCDATFEDVRAILRQLDMRLKGSGVDADTRGSAQLVLAEAMNNIVEHAFSDKSVKAAFHLRIEAQDDGLKVHLSDQGDPMPWTEVRNPGILRRPMSPEYAKEGGFGWSIIKALSQDVAYSREDGTNHLSFDLPSPDLTAPAPGRRRRDAYLFGEDNQTAN